MDERESEDGRVPIRIHHFSNHDHVWDISDMYRDELRREEKRLLKAWLKTQPLSIRVKLFWFRVRSKKIMTPLVYRTGGIRGVVKYWMQ